MTVAPLTPLAKVPSEVFENVEIVLTDMDDTLTRHGRLSAATYSALERLETAGVRVIPITAAPAGWCDQMVRMWPISAVIGENGGFVFTRHKHSVERAFWLEPDELAAATTRLAELARSVADAYPSVELSDDQPFRLTSLAFQRPSDHTLAKAIARHLEAAGASATLNSIWALAWFGGYDKIAAAKRFLSAAVGFDVDRDRDNIVFVGDSANDAPMFTHFSKSAGVSTVIEHLADIPHPPAWITRGPGGAGFVEIADAILAVRGSRMARGRIIEPA